MFVKKTPKHEEKPQQDQAYSYKTNNEMYSLSVRMNVLA